MSDVPRLSTEERTRVAAEEVWRTLNDRPQKKTLSDHMSIAAEAAWLRLFGRVTMLVLPPFLGFMCIKAWEFASKQDERISHVEERATRIEERYLSLSEKQLPAIITTINNAISVINDRATAAANRNDVQDGQIGEITKRLYQIPIPTAR